MKSNTYVRRQNFGTATSLILGLFFLFSVLLPLISVMTNLKNADIPAIFSHPQTVPAIFNSLKVSLTATAFSIIVAFIAAWCVNRTGVRLTALFDILLVVPMLIPSISRCRRSPPCSSSICSLKTARRFQRSWSQSWS